jgi:Transposase IS116/IS110/IS902 family
MPSGWFIRNVSTDRRSGQDTFKKPMTARRLRHRNDRSRSRNRRSRCRKHRSRSSEIRSQYSSGGKTRLGRITKAGDAYLRSLLVLGARAMLNAAQAKRDSLSRWALALAERRGYWKAVVAIAAKNARMAWAVLTKGESFKLPA